MFASRYSHKHPVLEHPQSVFSRNILEGLIGYIYIMTFPTILLLSLSHEMEAVCPSETLVTTYKTTQRHHKPEDYDLLIFLRTKKEQNY
jgi:hypothetical protein